MPEVSEREVTAHHEAGHAVAEVRRGGTVESIDIDKGKDGSLGATASSGCTFDMGFVLYAGPWAEAKFTEGRERLDGVDDDFFIVNGSDRAGFVEWEQWIHSGLSRPARTMAMENILRDWPAELNLLWPVICRVARLALADDPRVHDGLALTAVIAELLEPYPND